MTARGNEISPSKMPLMRIRSVEIVFEDEMSTCTDTGILDRSIELIVSDSSDDSTKCVDDLEGLNIEKDTNYDSVTLNADGDLSDDNSVSLTKDIVEDVPKVDVPLISFQDVDECSHLQTDSATLPMDETLSPNVSEIGDSGRYTEEASSSHFETIPIEDALLSSSMDAITIVKTPTLMSSYEISDVCSIAAETSRLYEYIDSNSDSSDDSDNTATCDMDHPIQHLTSISSNLSSDDNTVCDSYDLQYDSFIDMGKF
ncbi:hypothetical protein HF086_000438 [Spodoptera exigua]|uniref:Uncharacterized protein n=1 Tax=Spodoptera exigua TaxID=7107 RepID=A0A922SPH1_SPOEX|nr:hypothetical protein HF086_000438 [Spodoptera exigua]